MATFDTPGVYELIVPTSHTRFEAGQPVRYNALHEDRDGKRTNAKIVLSQTELDTGVWTDANVKFLAKDEKALEALEAKTAKAVASQKQRVKAAYAKRKADAMKEERELDKLEKENAARRAKLKE